jgi:hypothetical protein
MTSPFMDRRVDEAAAIEKAAAELKMPATKPMGDRAMIRRKAPAVISSANGPITWQFRPKRCGDPCVPVRHASAATFNPDDKAPALPLMPVRSRGPGPREARLSSLRQQADTGPALDAISLRPTAR